MKHVRGAALAFLIILAATLLSGCITPIPDHVLDRDWCLQMAASKAGLDAQGRQNIDAAMSKHRCSEKIAAGN